METEYKIHPIAALFPDLPAEELKVLADDIKKHGQHEPILYLGEDIYDGSGVRTKHVMWVIDGKNRLAACKLAGVDPDCRPFAVWCFAGIEEMTLPWMLDQAISANLMRRNLTPAQRSAIVVQADALREKLVAEENNKKRQTQQAEREQIKQEKQTEVRVAKTVLAATVGNPTAAVAGRTREKLAEEAKVSPDTIALVQKIQKQAPGRVKKIAAGKLSINEALANLPKPKVSPKDEAKKYPALDLPAVMPPSNKDTIKKLEIIQKGIDALLIAIKSTKLASVEEFACGKKIRDDLSDLKEEAEFLFSEYKHCELAAAFFVSDPTVRSGPRPLVGDDSDHRVNVQKAIKKHDEVSFLDYGGRGYFRGGDESPYTKDYMNALKKEMRVLGYWKTMGNTFKWVGKP
jgi:ParB-like chromosome segregation protein Spo0J